MRLSLSERRSRHGSPCHTMGAHNVGGGATRRLFGQRKVPQDLITLEAQVPRPGCGAGSPTLLRSARNRATRSGRDRWFRASHRVHLPELNT